MVPNINLLPKSDKRRSESNLLYIVLGAVAVLGLAFMAWQYISAGSQLKDVQAQQSNLQTELAALEQQYAALITVVPQGSIEESVTFVERVSYPVSPLIDETAELLPDNTYLTNYSFSEGAVTLAIDFESLKDVAEYVSKLEASSYFTDAQLSTVSAKELSVADETAVEEGSQVAANKRLEKFKNAPRYTTNITLAIDQAYLAAGGVQ